MCRSQSTETVRFGHISSEEDAIGFTIFKSKTKQEGETNKDPKHCYSNPLKPSVCLFVALGIYLACNSQITSNSLFLDHDKRIDLARAWAICSTENGDDTSKSGKKEIGTHSIRKGVATYACSGTTGGPSIVSVCLRCGWSIGNVMERYFRYEAAGDQFTGRVVAGLPVNSAQFAILPPHFSNSNHPAVINMLRLMFPNLTTMSHLYSVIRLILASLVYHHDFLVEILPPQHALLSSALFRNRSSQQFLESLLITGDESPIMRSTGIPPHIEVYKKLDRNYNSITSIPKVIYEGISKLLDEKGAASGNITKDVLESTISGAISKLFPHLNQQAAQIDDSSYNIDCSVEWWKEKLMILPDNIVFPSVDVATAWKLWWLGNPAQKLIPFSKIKLSFLPSRLLKNILAEWTYLMSRMERHFEEIVGHKMPKNPSEIVVVEAFDPNFCRHGKKEKATEPTQSLDGSEAHEDARKDKEGHNNCRLS
ncbi:hypothetical protein AeRB84_016405 [Aphanomyces euteiches]|nr:hypothetical protein AeRB84_016405 [Aphanomyces euteiches]